MPTSASFTFSNNELQPSMTPGDAKTDAVAIAPSATIAAGTVLGQKTTGGSFAPYLSTNTDGTQVAKAIAKYDMATDAAGNITIGLQTGGGPQGETYLTAPVYIAGRFNTADLIGLDSTAVGQLGRLVEGSLTAGVLKVN